MYCRRSNTFHCKRSKRAPEKLVRTQRGWRLVLAILNASIVENGVKIRQDCTRINGLIRRSCGEVKNKCRQLQGRTRVQYLQRLIKIAIRQKELINVRLIEEQIKKIRGSAKQLLYYVSKLM